MDCNLEGGGVGGGWGVGGLTKVWWVFRRLITTSTQKPSHLDTVGLQDLNLFIHTLFFYKCLSRVTDIINSFDYTLDKNILSSPALFGGLDLSIPHTGWTYWVIYWHIFCVFVRVCFQNLFRSSIYQFFDKSTKTLRLTTH